MCKNNNYRNLMDVIMEGEIENSKLKEYIKKILPEKADDNDYIERITCNVHNIYNEVDLNVDIYWVAENYINILREVEAF